MISVCMATHNGELFIKDQLESILKQLSSTDEIIISDDGSTDKTLEIIKNFNDPRIVVYNFKQPPNRMSGYQANMLYASRNFENAIKKANGDLILLSDQDDVWYDNKVKIISKILEEVDIVKHNYSTIDKYGKLIKKSVYNTKIQENRGLYHLLKYLPFRGCCMAFNRSVMESCFPFPSECLQHDSWIGMIARLGNFKFKYLDTPLIYHRIHGNNVSELPIDNSLRYKIYYRLNLIYQCLTWYINRKNNI